ncbi:MAG: GDSL-type esterase/lipase family protein [Campylobacterota bacterium]|nr:GDSL-type esterase/lipase family protein [Campylobacterota bacterium]
MKNILIVLTIIFILIMLKPKEANIKSLNSQDTILAFGDSLTFGFNALPKESYPSILAQLTGQKVINAGLNGDTSGDGLKRLPQLLHDPSIKRMVLCFGGNDILQNLPLDRLKQNLISMIQMAKEKDIEVLLVAVPNITLFGLTSLNLYEEVAKSENVALSSGILTDILSQSSLKSDQIHPNAQGYKQMAEEIYVSLKEYNLL